MVRDRVGAWYREPGIDWIHGDGPSITECYGYEHDNGEVSAWLRRRDYGTWDIRASSSHTNEMRVAEGLRVTRQEAFRVFYSWLVENSEWEWRERPNWLLDMNDEGVDRRDPRDDFGL